MFSPQVPGHIVHGAGASPGKEEWGEPCGGGWTNVLAESLLLSFSQYNVEGLCVTAEMCLSTMDKCACVASRMWRELGRVGLAAM